MDIHKFLSALTKMYSLILIISCALTAQVTFGQECATAGMQCDTTCANIVLCPEVGGTPTQIRACTDGKFCGTNGTWFDCIYDHCSNNCAPHKFLCLQQGTFPSPYQCDKSFICTEIGATPQLECTCKTGEYFDIPTQSCKAGACPRTPVDCQSPGQTGNVESYCYACTEAYDAYVYRCNFAAADSKITRSGTCGSYTGLADNNENPTTTTAKPGDDATTTAKPGDATTTTAKPGDDATTTTTAKPGDTKTTTTPKPISSMCKVSGQRIVDPVDCHRYYECNAQLRAIHLTCQTNYHYDRMRYGCVEGFCYNQPLTIV